METSAWLWIKKMKWLSAQGLQKKTCGTITEEMKTDLGKKGILGQGNPGQIIRTVYFIVGQFFGSNLNIFWNIVFTSSNCAGIIYFCTVCIKV